jgi:hypothetical protein
VTAALCSHFNPQRFQDRAGVEILTQYRRILFMLSRYQTRESNFFEAIMNAEFDYDLAPDQWEALKALRLPAAERRLRDRPVVESLIALQLAVMNGDGPVITPRGRSVLLRGSPRLWDVAA